MKLELAEHLMLMLVSRAFLSLITLPIRLVMMVLFIQGTLFNNYNFGGSGLPMFSENILDAVSARFTAR